MQYGRESDLIRTGVQAAKALSCLPRLTRHSFSPAQKDNTNSNETLAEGQKKEQGRENDGEDSQGEEDKEASTQEIEQTKIDPTSPYLYQLFSVIIHCGSSAGTRSIIQFSHSLLFSRAQGTRCPSLLHYQ